MPDPVDLAERVKARLKGTQLAERVKARQQAQAPAPAQAPTEGDATDEMARQALSSWGGMATPAQEEGRMGGSAATAGLAPARDRPGDVPGFGLPASAPIAGPMASLLHSMQGVATPSKTADEAFGKGIGAAASTVFLPANIGLSMLPEGAQKAVNAALEPVDKYVAQPLGWLTTGFAEDNGNPRISETVRGAANVATPLLAGAAAGRVAGAVGRAASPFKAAPEIGPPTGGVVRQARPPVEVATPEITPEGYRLPPPQSLVPVPSPAPTSFAPFDAPPRAVALQKALSEGNVTPGEVRPKIDVTSPPQTRRVVGSASPPPGPRATATDIGEGARLEVGARLSREPRVLVPPPPGMEVALGEIGPAGASEATGRMVRFARGGDASALLEQSAPQRLRTAARKAGYRSVWDAREALRTDENAAQAFRAGVADEIAALPDPQASPVTATEVTGPIGRPAALEPLRGQGAPSGQADVPSPARVQSGAIRPPMESPGPMDRPRTQPMQQGRVSEPPLLTTTGEYPGVMEPGNAPPFRDASDFTSGAGQRPPRGLPAPEAPPAPSPSTQPGGTPAAGASSAKGGGTGANLGAGKFRSGTGLGGRRGGGSQGGQLRIPSWEDIPKPDIDRYVESFRKQYGKVGAEVSDKLGKTYALYREYVGKALTDFDVEMGKVPLNLREEASRDLIDWVKRTKPTPQWADNLVRAARNATKQNALNTIDANLLIQDPVTGWRHMNPFLDEMFTHRIKPEVRDALVAEHQPTHTGPTPWTDKWKQANPGKPDPFEIQAPTTGPSFKANQGFYAGAEMRRSYNIPREFMPEDSVQTLRSHIHRTALRAAENKVFNQTRRSKMGGWTVDGGDLDILLREAQNQGLPSAQIKARIDRILERNPLDVQSKASAAFNRGASLLTTGTKLVGSLEQIAQQPSQMVNAATETGIGPMLKGAAQFARNPAESIRQARLRGDIQPDAYRRSLDLVDESHGSKAYRKASALASIFQMPQSAVDVASRAITSEAAPYHLRNVMDAATKGGSKAAWAERAMTRLDLPEEFKAEIRSGKPSPEAQRMFRQRLTGYTNIEAGVTEFPRIGGPFGEGPTAPRHQWLRSLKNYPIASARTFAESVVSEATKGNMRPALRWMIGSIVVGEMVGATRGAFSSSEKETDWKNVIDKAEKGDYGPLGKRLGRDIAMGGTAGIAGPIAAAFVPDDVMKGPGLEDIAIRFVTPPMAMDAFRVLQRGHAAMKNQTAPEKARIAAAQGRDYTRQPETPRTRVESVQRQGWKLLRDIAPQIYRYQDRIRLEMDKAYARQQLAEVSTMEGLPQKGQEQRYRFIKEATR